MELISTLFECKCSLILGPFPKQAWASLLGDETGIPTGATPDQLALPPDTSPSNSQHTQSEHNRAQSDRPAKPHPNCWNQMLNTSSSENGLLCN